MVFVPSERNSQEHILKNTKEIEGYRERRISTVRVDSELDLDPFDEEEDFVTIQPRGLPRDVIEKEGEYSIRRVYNLKCPEGRDDEAARLPPIVAFRTPSDNDNLHLLPATTGKAARDLLVVLDFDKDKKVAAEQKARNDQLITDGKKAMLKRRLLGLKGQVIQEPNYKKFVKKKIPLLAENKPDVPKPGDPKPGDLKPGDPKPGDPKQGDPKPLEPKPVESKTEKPKPEELKTGKVGEEKKPDSIPKQGPDDQKPLVPKVLDPEKKSEEPKDPEQTKVKGKQGEGDVPAAKPKGSSSEEESSEESSESEDDDYNLMGGGMGGFPMMPFSGGTMPMMPPMFGMGFQNQSYPMPQYGGGFPGYGATPYGGGYPYPPQNQFPYPPPNPYPEAVAQQPPCPPPPCLKKKKKAAAECKAVAHRKKTQGLNFDFLPHDNCCTEVTLTIEPDEPDPLECAVENGIMPIVCCYMPPAMTLEQGNHAQVIGGRMTGGFPCYPQYGQPQPHQPTSGARVGATGSGLSRSYVTELSSKSGSSGSGATSASSGKGSGSARTSGNGVTSNPAS